MPRRRNRFGLATFASGENGDQGMKPTERVANWALIVIAVVLTFAALDSAEVVIAPIVLALVAGIVLSPVTESLDRLGLPHTVAALSSFLVGVIAIVILVMLAQPIVVRTAEVFPKVWREVNTAMYSVQGEIQSIREMAENAKSMLNPDNLSEQPEAVPANNQGGGGQGEDALPTVEDVIFMAPTIASQMLIFVGALFFFILTRKDIYVQLAARLARPDERDAAALRLRHAERQVSRYFLTISLINFGLGLCVSAAMAAIGMPSPGIWGALAFVLNYFLYVGPSLLIAVLLLAGLTVFDGLQVLLPAAIFVTFNMIESQFVTPSLIGRSLSVNPLLVFLSLVIFMWLWGPMGAIVAIPLLVWGLVLTADIRDLRRAEAERLAKEAEAEPG
jgi:predicted PurR-regulated permease PerM